MEGKWLGYTVAAGADRVEMHCVCGAPTTQQCHTSWKGGKQYKDKSKPNLNTFPEGAVIAFYLGCPNAVARIPGQVQMRKKLASNQDSYYAYISGVTPVSGDGWVLLLCLPSLETLALRSPCAQTS